MANRFPFSGMSIQKRLPLLICILLLSVIVIFSYTSYLGVKDAALRAGTERLQSLTGQVSSMFRQFGEVMLKSTRQTSSQPAVINFLKKPEKEDSIKVLQILDRMEDDTLISLVELFDVNGGKVLTSSRKKVEIPVNRNNFLPGLSAPAEFGEVGKIYLIGNAMYYPVTVTIASDNKIIGYMINWRRLVTTQQAIEQFSKLTGSRGALEIGNDDCKFWTNGLVPITSPPVDPNKVKNVINYNGPDGYPVIASAQHIPGTHWLILIAISQDTVQETATIFLQRIILIGGALVLIGIFIAWLISRNILKPLQQLTVATVAIAEGNYNLQVAIHRKDELGKLARAFNDMTLKRNKYEDELQSTGEQLRQLAAHLQNIREEERTGIAREIHDVIGQQLTAIKIDVSLLTQKIDSSDPAIAKKITSLLQLIDETINITRKISSQLRPDVLEDLGLVEALNWQSREFTGRTGIYCDFTCNKEELDIEKFVSFNLYRIYQEALTNIARHAGATEVNAGLQCEDDKIILSISDNGKGFNMEEIKAKKRLGIVGMKERIISIKGNYHLETSPGNGVHITITVPLP